MHVDYALSISDLPRDCIEDCSAIGPVDNAVAQWCDTLVFTVNRERAIRCLAGYGAWERDELAMARDDLLAERILWIACCNFSEFIVYCERSDVDPLNPPEGFDSPAGSDIFVLE